MPTFVATLRAIYSAEDEVTAALIADKIRENGSQELNDDEDSDDQLWVTQVTSNVLDISPEESITLFKKARNALIKTRIRQCLEMAREFDKMIYTLEHRSEQGFELANYDYTEFIEVCDAILMHNESPID